MTCKLLLHSYIVAERYFQQLEVNSIALLTALTRSGASVSSRSPRSRDLYVCGVLWWECLSVCLSVCLWRWWIM